MSQQENAGEVFADETTVVAVKHQVSCDLSGEAVILSFKDGTYYGLNAVGARIWNLVEKPRTIKEIRDTLLQEFDVEPAQCESDLQAFLREMAGRNLIEIVGPEAEDTGPDRDQ